MPTTISVKSLKCLMATTPCLHCGSANFIPSLTRISCWYLWYDVFQFLFRELIDVDLFVVRRNCSYEDSIIGPTSGLVRRSSHLFMAHGKPTEVERIDRQGVQKPWFWSWCRLIIRGQDGGENTLICNAQLPYSQGVITALADGSTTLSDHVEKNRECESLSMPEGSVGSRYSQTHVMNLSRPHCSVPRMAPSWACQTAMARFVSSFQYTMQPSASPVSRRLLWRTKRTLCI
jgi:hypothetical protein